MNNSLLRWSGPALAALAAATLAPAYDLIYGTGGARVTWNSGAIPFTIRMAQTPTLQDGSNHATSVQAAMTAWNANLVNVQLSGTIAAAGLAGDGDGLNEIAFDSKIYSNNVAGPDGTGGPEEFGPSVLAVTLSYRSQSPRGDGTYERTQSDILFNTAWDWNSYRGNLQQPEDIRRVAIHELGHVLGLSHPDEDGQTVAAIMNSTASHTDSLQTDDIVGAQFLYGRPGGNPAPANDNFASATSLTLSNNSATANTSSVGATKESGEPGHAPNQPGGASVWWRWTAPSNGTLTVTTLGSNFDTMLAAYTGGSVGALTQLAANDDTSDTERRSTVTLTATNGATYSFAVDGWDGQWGSVALNLSFTPTNTDVAPAITSHPGRVGVTEGQTVQFSIAATGTPAPSYQWQRLSAAGGSWGNLANSGNYSGVNTTTLTVANTTTSMSGDSFRCIASNTAGTATSNEASLDVQLPARITSHPSDVTLTATGGTAIFAVSVVGVPAPLLKWQRAPAGGDNWSDLANDGTYSGVSTVTLTITNITPAMNGDKFRCVISSLAGSVASMEATLNISTLAAPLLASGGHHHGAFVRLDGTLWGIGLNQESLFGAGGSQPVLAPHSARVVQTSSGADHLAILKSDGSLWTTGYNPFGGLGTGNLSHLGTPQQIATNVAQVAAGTYHTVFRLSDGTLWATGWNNDGQLGDGSTVSRSSPVQVATGVVFVAASYAHTLFVKSDGTLWATGNNGAGQFGNGTTTVAKVPVQVGTRVRTVAAGFYHALILDADGILRATGGNFAGQLGDGTGVQRLSPVVIADSVVAVAAGYAHSVYLKADGSLWAMGANDRGQLGDGTTTARLSPVQVATQVTALATGAFSTYCIKADGTLWATGNNETGQLGDGSTTDRSAFVQVAAGAGGLPIDATHANATNSATNDRISVTWNHARGALYYRVWRHSTNDALAATMLADRVVGNFFEDSSATAGLDYYYWIQPVNPYGALPLGGWSIGRQGASGTAPAITSQPGNQAVTAGDSVTFSVTATGTAPLTYQWRKAQQPITGANASTYTIPTAQPADAGNYDVVVTNPYGFVSSAAATLVVKLAQTITINPIPDLPFSNRNQPIQATSSSGLPVTLTVESGPIAISNNQMIFLGIGSVTIRATQAGNAEYAPAPDVVRSFTVTPPELDLFANAKFLTSLYLIEYATNKFSSLEQDEPEHVAGQPGGASIWWKWRAPVGADVVVTTRGSDFNTQLAVYTGTAPGNLVRVAANDDEAPGSVATSSVRFLAAADTYYYFAVAGHAGATGSVQLNLAGIPSNGGAPTITTQPSDITVSVGQTVGFAFAYSGAPPVMLTWERLATGSTVWEPAATHHPYEFQATAAMDGDQYRCTATNSYGSVTSNIARLAVNKLSQTINFPGPLDQAFSAMPLALSATASSGLPVSFAISSGPAQITGTQLTLTGAGTVTVRATQGGDATYAAAQNIERSFTVRESVVSWQKGFFTDAELRDSAIAGPNADPDRDGVPNLIEYALGLDPRAASASGGPAVGLSAGNWSFTYTRPADRTDLAYRVECSTDLLAWSTVSATKVSSTDGVEIWRADTAATTSNCFFRLVVTR